VLPVALGVRDGGEPGPGSALNGAWIAVQVVVGAVRDDLKNLQGLARELGHQLVGHCHQWVVHGSLSMIRNNYPRVFESLFSYPWFPEYLRSIRRETRLSGQESAASVRTPNRTT
jgi:hypothetical protein